MQNTKINQILERSLLRDFSPFLGLIPVNLVGFWIAANPVQSLPQGSCSVHHKRSGQLLLKSVASSLQWGTPSALASLLPVISQAEIMS